MPDTPTIAEIAVRAWDVPMRSPYQSARRTTTTAHNVLVKVTLADGSVGWGEAAPAAYVTGETQESVVLAVQGAIPALVGKTVAAAREQVAGLTQHPGARAALETALCDAAARAARVPLYRFLGGAADTPTDRTTDLSLPLLPPADAARAALSARDGFRALKIKVGGPDTDEDAARVRAVAAAAPHATLRLDGNQGFSPDGAVRFMDSLGDLAGRIELLEQPTLAGDDAALRFVSERVICPVFADEAVQHPADATRLVGGGICGGVVLKVAKSGLSETEAIARATFAAGGVCLFGCMMETRIAIGAALHLALALGTEIVPLLDLDGTLLVRDDDLVTGGWTREGDVLRANPGAAGLGVMVG